MILICCTGDNFKFTRMSVKHGYKYGCQLPCTVYDKLYFADQDWKKARSNPFYRQKYMDSLRLYKPTMATVLDLETASQYDTVISWATEASHCSPYVIIIPKINGVILDLPTTINKTKIILGYSVPTRYGGTTVPISEFGTRPVHLLGGSPLSQLSYIRRMNVVSVDCNFHLRMANTSCSFFSNIPNWLAKNPNWPTLKEADGKRQSWTQEGSNPRLEAFKRSCEAIIDFWKFHSISISDSLPF